MNLKLDRIHKIDNDSRFKGSASVIIDDCFIVTNIKIIEGENGLFLAMPNKILKDGKSVDIVHPLNKETREQFTKLIIDAYNNLDNE